MSKCTKIVCSMCGKDLYSTLGIKELREKKSKHVEFYQVTVDGIEDEVCSKCYEYLKDWKGSMRMKKIRLLSEQDVLDAISRVGLSKKAIAECLDAVEALTPLTPDVLANMLMEERIMGELKQDISYSKDVIDNVRCKLTVEIIDHRPAYCGAELREVWREDEQ